MPKFWLAALATLSLASCQTIQSRHVNLESGGVANGLHYAAPKALMKVELVAVNGELKLYISQPFLIGDPDATYVLDTSSGLFSDNRNFFVVNPQTRLLTHVNTSSTGRAGQILTALAKSVGAISGMSGGPTNGDEAGAINVGPIINGTLLSTFIDPFTYKDCDFGAECELHDLNTQLTKRAKVFLGCDIGSRQNENPVQCGRLNDPNGYFHVTMTPMFKVITQPIAARDVVKPAACTSSICYRAPAPYLFGVKIGDGTDESRLVMMPNEAPIMAMDLPTGVFASAKARVDLVHGMPATVGISQESELLQIVAIPLNVIDGFFKGVGQVFSIRIAYDNSKVSMLRSSAARRDAERAYNQQRVEETARALRDAEAKLTAVQTADYGSAADAAEKRDAAMQAARATIAEAAEDNRAAIAQRDADDARFALEQENGSGDDEAGNLDTYLAAAPDADGNNAGLAAAQKAQITVLDETALMFSLNVVDSASAGKTTSQPRPADPSGSSTMQAPPGAETTIDPDAANRATDDN